MDPAVIVLIGTLVMVGCLLGLRWHAFLSLLLGALTVAMLTPTARRERQALRPSTAPTERWERATGEVRFIPRSRPPAEGRVVLLSDSGDWSHPLGTALLLASKSGETATWHLTELKLESGDVIPDAGLRLISAPQYQQQRQVASAHPMARVAEGFGSTCRSIGFLILLASILGRCLSESRAADRIVLWIREVLGDSRAPQGFAVSGFLLAIPSFFDTVFYLLMPLGRGLAAQTRRDFLLYTLTIVAGATMAHSLVPPTPGPLFVANELGVTLGQMMLGGVVVGGSSVVVGVAYARWANRRWPLPLRPETEAAASHSNTSSTDSRGLPPLVFSFLPIAVPIGLIALAELRKAFAPTLGSLAWLEAVGQGQTALLLGTGIALVLAASRLSWDWKRVAPFVSQAVSSGSSLLMITAAGGALGAVIRQTDIADQLSSISGGGGFRLLIAAFGITALIRIVQGSATVAMITAAGILAPIAASSPPPFHPVYLALAIGCGSKPVPWLNDSGFWIISRMSGMNETETLRSASVMMSLMGCVGFGVVLLGAWLLPLR